MGDVLNSWYDSIKQWLISFYAWLTTQAETLFSALSQRLAPIIEQLKPIWQDPLWQALALIFLVVLLVLLGKWLFGVLKGFTGNVIDALVGGGKSLAKLIAKPFTWLWQKCRLLPDKLKSKRSFSQRLNFIQVRRAVDAIQYLTTRREWRYHMAWTLLIGEEESGKTTLTNSVRKGRRAQLLPKEKRMTGGDSGWHFFEHGIVIEPKGNDVNATLEQLHWYRPERPIDNIVLCISAKTLMNRGSPAALEELGQSLFQQLWATQKQTGFILPVYLFVTQCDCVEGFEAFWNTQEPDTKEQMLGWSNPYRLDTAFDLTWVKQTFEQLSESLQNAQLQVAAGGREIADIDRFMLFLHHFSKLQAPLTQVLKAAFARSSLQEAQPLRGIYFCGELEGKTAFVEDTFEKKIFAEKNLSSIIEKRQLSSNKLLRRMQIGSVIGAILLTINLVYDIRRINIYNNYTVDELQLLKRITPDCSPQGTDTYQLLRGLNKISDSAGSLSMPLSWFDNHARDKQAQVAEHLLQTTLFAGMDCRLKQRAASLSAITAQRDISGNYHDLQQQFDDFATQLLSFEKSQAAFVTLAGPLESGQGISKSLLNLLDYLYDNPVPDDIELHTELIVGAVRVSDYSADWMINSTSLVNREDTGRYLDRLTNGLQQALLKHADSIPIEPIQAFNADTARVADDATLLPSSIKSDAKNLDLWVQKTNEDWITRTPESSPCGVQQSKVSLLGQQLKEYGYDSKQLAGMERRFQPEQCDQPVRTDLTEINASPFGVLYKLNTKGILTETNALQALIRQLKLIIALPFVNESFAPAIDSSEAIVLWQEAPLQQLLDYLLSYQDYLTKPNPTNLFENAVNSRLQQVTERLLSSAMVRPSQQVTAPEPVNDLIAWQERNTSNAVSSFKQSREQLLQVQSMLQQLDDSANSLLITQQTQRFISAQLKTLEKLVSEYHLYQPVASPQWQKQNFADAMFNLSDDKEAQTYLVNQRQQMSYFAFNYAQPLLQFLQNSETGLSDSLVQRWLVTLQDLSKFDRGEPNNEVSLLDDLISEKLVQLTNQQCADARQFDASHPSAGWFAKRRNQIEGQVNLHCADADKQVVINRYMKVANLFNTEMAGVFPFADVSKASATNLKPKTVKDFLTQYRQDTKNLQTDLNNLMQQDKSIPGSWRDFIAQMDAISLFFAAIWQDKPKQWVATIDVGFDALENNAKGSNQILFWALTSGQTQARFPNGSNQVVWRPGETLQLDLRWATGSPYLPLGLPDNSPDNPLYVDRANLTARFESKSQWALFEWLAQYNNDSVTLQEQQHLLSFYVPVAVKGQSTQLEAPAYVSRSNIVIQVVVEDTKGESKAVAVPSQFPTSAPGLNE